MSEPRGFVTRNARLACLQAQLPLPLFCKPGWKKPVFGFLLVSCHVMCVQRTVMCWLGL